MENKYKGGSKTYKRKLGIQFKKNGIDMLNIVISTLYKEFDNNIKFAGMCHCISCAAYQLSKVIPRQFKRKSESHGGDFSGLIVYVVHNL